LITVVGLPGLLGERYVRAPGPLFDTRPVLREAVLGPEVLEPKDGRHLVGQHREAGGDVALQDASQHEGVE